MLNIKLQFVFQVLRGRGLIIFYIKLQISNLSYGSVCTLEISNLIVLLLSSWLISIIFNKLTWSIYYSSAQFNRPHLSSYRFRTCQNQMNFVRTILIKDFKVPIYKTNAVNQEDREMTSIKNHVREMINIAPSHIWLSLWRR
jgi:hypothetical protein